MSIITANTTKPPHRFVDLQQLAADIHHIQICIGEYRGAERCPHNIALAMTADEFVGMVVNYLKENTEKKE